MRKEEYLQKLEKLLYDIPAEDREEALQFYHDYLEDAQDAASEVLEALGTPEELAQSIRRDLYGDNADGDFTRSGKDLPGTKRVTFSTGGKFSGSDDFEREHTKNGRQNAEGYYEYDRKEERKARKGKLSTGQWILIIILLLCALPVVLPVGGGLLVAVLTIIITVIAVVCGIGVAGIALVIAAIAIVVVALVKLVATPITAVLMLGGGLLSAGLGLIGIALTVWVLFKIIPSIFKWCMKICSGFIHK